MNTKKPQPTILLVDDEALFRHSVTDALSALCSDYRVLQATHGREALEHVQGTEVDVIVSDISMPVMDGLQLLLALREQRWTGPVIIVTAFGNPRLESGVTRQGAFSYLEKPVDLHELIDAIRSAVEGEHSHIEGLTLSGFAQLLTLERKTCRLRVSDDERFGDLFFTAGQLVDARLGQAVGERAAIDLLSWDSPSAKLDLYTQFQSQRTTIEAPLNHLLLEAMRLKDEAQEEARRGNAAPGNAAPGNAAHGDATLGDAAHGDAAPAEAADGDRPLVPDPAQAEVDADPVVNAGPIVEALRRAMDIENALGVALVDHQAGTCLGHLNVDDTLNIEAAALGNIEVFRLKMRLIEDLQLEDSIEDILISLGHQFHLIRPAREAPHHFLYLALDRAKTNLALARHGLKTIEKTLQL